MLLIAPIKFSAYSDAQRVETIIPLAIVYGYGSGDVNALLHNFKATEPVAHRLLRFFTLFNKLEEHTGRRVPEHLIVEVLDDYIDLLVRITDQLRKYFNLEMRNGPLVETLWFIEDRNDQNRVCVFLKSIFSSHLRLISHTFCRFYFHFKSIHLCLFPRSNFLAYQSKKFTFSFYFYYFPMDNLFVSIRL